MAPFTLPTNFKFESSVPPLKFQVPEVSTPESNRDKVQLDLLQARCEVAETEIARLQKILDETQDELSKLEQDYTNLLTAKTKLDVEYTLVQNEWVIAGSECREAKNELEIAEAKNKAFKTEKEQHHIDMSDLQKKYEEALMRIQKQEDSIGSLEEHINDIEGKLVAAEDEIKKEKKNTKNVKDLLDQEKRKGEDLEGYLNDMNKKFGATTEENDRLEREEERLKAALQRQQQKTRDLEDARKNVQERFDSYVDASRNLNAENTNKELAAKKEEIATKDAKIASLQAEALARATATTEEIQGLRQQIIQLRIDSKPRVSTHPGHYQGSVEPKKKARDLEDELNGDSTTDTTNDTVPEPSSSSPSSSDSEPDDGKKKEPKVIYKEVVKVVKVPGPVITRTVVVNRPARNPSRLEAWFGTERDFIVLIVQSFIAAIGWLLSLGIASRLRAETIVDPEPVEVTPENSPEADTSSSTPRGNAPADPTNLQASISIGTQAAPGGPAPGTDPADPENPGDGSTSSNPNANLESLIPPLGEGPDNRSRIPSGNGGRRPNSANGRTRLSGSSTPNPNANPNGNPNGNGNNGGSGTGNNGGGGPPPPPPPPPPANPASPQESFFDILGARRPPVQGTLFAMLLHLIFYYFVYVCISAYFEREKWYEANEPARQAAFELIQHRNRYSRSLWHDLFGTGVAGRFDTMLLIIVQLFGVQNKPYPLPG